MHVVDALALNKSAYVPPHLRNVQRAASNPSPNFNGYIFLSLLCCCNEAHDSYRNGGGWAGPRTQTPPPAAARGGFNTRGNGFADRGRGAFSNGSRSGTPVNDWAGNPPPAANWSAPQPAPTHRADAGARETFGYGVWRDGKHVVGGRNMRLEKELFGDANDPSKQHTGINFEKYDDIPVEATGAGVPEPVLSFTSPPLDPTLLENIGFAMYTTPTPVQKYSIPIVSGGRDLMACAQVNSFWLSLYLIHLADSTLIDRLRENRRFPFPYPLRLFRRRTSCSTRADWSHWLWTYPQGIPNGVNPRSHS